MSLPLLPTLTVTLTEPLACPSLTLTIRTAVPVRPATAVAVSVRLAPLPPKTTLLLGTSVGLDVEATVSVSAVAGLSMSPTVRLILPERSLVPHAPPAATVTVGASLTAVTVIVTVAVFDCRVPSLAW